MTETIAVKHFQGQVEISYEDLSKYHDKDHWGGVALAFKIIQYAARELNNNQPLDRNLVSVKTGLNPPGLMDAFEFLTRAVTRQRIIVDPSLDQGPASPFGKFAFVVQYGKSLIGLRLKAGILPDDFAELGHKCEAGFGTEEETERWNGLKHGLGDKIMKHDPAEILEITEKSIQAD